MSRVLVVATHPDDETLGCGGTLLKHSQRREGIWWAIMTNISVEENYTKENVCKRQREIDAVAHQYRFRDVFKLDLPSTKLDTIPKHRMITILNNVVREVKPNVIYLPNRSDVHSDHRVTFEVVMSLAKTFRFPFVKRMLMYETISETEFAPAILNNTFCPNSFSDITDFINKKLSIMKIYKSELGECPFPRSLKNIKALATFRGATAGVKYAEAFMVLKDVW